MTTASSSLLCGAAAGERAVEVGLLLSTPTRSIVTGLAMLEAARAAARAAVEVSPSVVRSTTALSGGMHGTQENFLGSISIYATNSACGLAANRERTQPSTSLWECIVELLVARACRLSSFLVD